MILITCPECKHPVSEHNQYICLASFPDPKRCCPCNKGAEEIMLEFIEVLSMAAKFSASVIKSQGMYERSEQMAFEKLTQALVGIEIVEEAASE